MIRIKSSCSSLLILFSLHCLFQFGCSPEVLETVGRLLEETNQSMKEYSEQTIADRFKEYFPNATFWIFDNDPNAFEIDTNAGPFGYMMVETIANQALVPSLDELLRGMSISEYSTIILSLEDWVIVIDEEGERIISSRDSLVNGVWYKNLGGRIQKVL